MSKTFIYFLTTFLDTVFDIYTFLLALSNLSNKYEVVLYHTHHILTMEVIYRYI